MIRGLELGCDPELLLKDLRDTTISARDVLHVLYGYEECCRDEEDFDEDLLSTEVGLDGDYSIAEIRPQPTSDIPTLIERIKRLLGELLLVGYRPSILRRRMAGVGGHIHLSLETDESWAKIACRAKSALVATSWVNLIHPLSNIKRNRVGWGFIEWKDEQRRNNLKYYYFEVRTLSDAWLVSPDVAELVLRKFVYYFKNYEEITREDIEYFNKLHFYKDIYEGIWHLEEGDVFGHSEAGDYYTAIAEKTGVDIDKIKYYNKNDEIAVNWFNYKVLKTYPRYVLTGLIPEKVEIRELKKFIKEHSAYAHVYTFKNTIRRKYGIR